MSDLLTSKVLHQNSSFNLGTINKRRLLWGGGRGVWKIENWGDFQGLNGETGGGRGVKNFEKWGDVFCGWSLIHITLNILVVKHMILVCASINLFPDESKYVLETGANEFWLDKKMTNSKKILHFYYQKKLSIV